MNKLKIIFVISALVFTFIIIGNIYFTSESQDGGYSIVVYSSENLTNVKFILPAVTDPVTGEIIDISSSGTYNIVNRSMTENQHGRMLIARFNESSLAEIGPGTFDTWMYQKLLVEKPWAKKVGDMLVANSLPKWEVSLNPKYNEEGAEIKLRYGLGYVSFPPEGIEKGKEFNKTIFQELEKSLIFKKFDTFGMAEFEGNGTIEISIGVGGCRIKKFFFLPIPPDARDSVCYNLAGGFTTNKSGEFVPFQIVGAAFRRISP